MKTISNMNTLRKPISVEDIDEMVDEEAWEYTQRPDLIFLMAQLLKWQRDCLLDYIEDRDGCDPCALIEELDCLFDPDGEPSESGDGTLLVPFCECCKHRGYPDSECIKHLWETQMKQNLVVDWGNWDGKVYASDMRKRVAALRAMKCIKKKREKGPSDEELRKIEREEKRNV